MAARRATAARVAAAMAAAIGALLGAAAAATASTADDKSTAQAVLAAQIAETKQEQALNKCLAASPHRNTPCIRRQALLLARLDEQHIASIGAALDGTEAPCVRTVALKEIAYLRLWKAGALALHADQRQRGKRLFIKSLGVFQSIKTVEPACFSQALTGG